MNRGSEWLRWDVHIHAPGTALANEYPADSWDEYVSRINKASPGVVALGVTDYLSLRGYKSLRKRWIAKKIPGVRFIFPNIEFRVSPPTRRHRGVNFHLLIDPSEDDHIERIENALARLTFSYREEAFNCNESGLTRLGKTLDPNQQDDHAAYCNGVNAFKIDFSTLCDWFRQDAWLERHCLVAVTNKERDGVAGLSREHGYAATIEEMYRFAQMVFSGNPADRTYWLGQGTDDPDQLEQRFGGLKPCLHGSDAHNLNRVLSPDGSRFCWIRAEPSFEGLRQVVFEPKERVHIGPDRPARPRQNWVRSLRLQAQNWFPAESIELNEGLVAIIGPRGSGKTALADLIAHGADAFEGGPASFLNKAMPHASGSEISLLWADRDDPEERVVGEESQDYGAAVRYLSQHFVEQLCSSDGASDKLIESIEEVVFEALDETDRADASSFEELRSVVTEGSIRRIQQLRREIVQCNEEIAREHAAKTGLPVQRNRLKKLDLELSSIQTSLSGLVVKGKEQKALALQKIREEATKLENVISELKSKARRIDELRLDLEQRERRNSEYQQSLRKELIALGIAKDDLPAFQLSFGGDFKAVLVRRSTAIAQEITSYQEGPKPPAGFSRSLVAVRKDIEVLQKEIGGDKVKERQLVELQRKQKAKQQERAKLAAEIKRSELADGKIRNTQEKRIERYLDIFKELDRQREELDKLYRPLAERLSTAPPERRKLEFFVRQVVDIEGWATRGEQLVDLRRKGEFFRDPGSLEKKGEELLGDAWRLGDRNRLREGMSKFLEIFKDASKRLAPTTTLTEFADWLFSMDHVRITYGIRYEGTDIERLSPGSRGIVLLILYLALETEDDRPLIIDQPEENLDPKSVFDVLTGYFRETRERRQVIVVTHNPNLVVNTDADQVIIANADPVAGALPRFSYESGGLENPGIRKQVCQILEGGEQAFLQRERRYGLGRGP